MRGSRHTPSYGVSWFTLAGFPDEENIGGFLRHVRFVRDHHRKVERIALAVDGRLASLGPRLARHFVEAEVKSFEYDELEPAIAWAGQSDARSAQTRAPGSAPRDTRVSRGKRVTIVDQRVGRSVPCAPARREPAARVH